MGIEITSDDEISSGADIYGQLRADILSCAMRPGAQFQERQIAERFNVSKSPVRDALIKLQEQNLVVVIPRRGYRVARVSVTDARELYEMRAILEREAILRLIDSAEDDLLRDLDAFREAPKVEALEDWIAYNRNFHLALVRNCGNSRLARAGTEVVEQFDRLTHMSVSSTISGEKHEGLRLRDRMAEHCQIIDAVQARDKRRATMLAREHLEGSRRRLLEALESASIVL